MVKVKDAEVPEGLYFSKDYEWVKQEGNKARIGITDFAQKQLREIVYVELPSEGDTVTQNEPYGTVESVKAVAELYMPMGGEILAVNTALEDFPGLVNESPHSDGWIIRIKQSNPDELNILMNKETYLKMLEGMV